MPITYEHRVPASTLGGLALAAGQEQYEAQRGREDRARAMQLAQMAQQQQMQNQRMAYDAASTQYRTMADYNKFVAGAQLDVFNRQQMQDNRIALMDHQDQLGAARQQVQWDRAAEQAGQQDTFQAWNGFVKDTLPTLNQDGREILNTHAGKVRTIMSNQKFTPPQKAAAISQVLEEVQGLNLGQSYAIEQMYEPGKSYVSPHGYKFTVRQDGTHQTLGQNFDDLIKPPEMSPSDWESTGKHRAWLDSHRFGIPGRDSDGRQTHMVYGPDGKMTEIKTEDDIFKAEQQRELDDQKRKDDEDLQTTRSKDRSDFIGKYLDRMDIDLGKISQMEGNGPDGLLSPWEKRMERQRRLEEAEEAANRHHPSPPRRVPPANDPAAGAQPPGQAAAQPQAAQAPQGIPAQLQRPPEEVAPADPADPQAALRTEMNKMLGETADPWAKEAMRSGIEALDAVIGGAQPTPEMEDSLRNARKAMDKRTAMLKRATEEGTSIEDSSFGPTWQAKVRRQQALNRAESSGIAAAEEKAAQGIFPGMNEPKVPFERTEAQVRAEEAIRRRRERLKKRPSTPIRDWLVGRENPDWAITEGRPTGYDPGPEADPFGSEYARSMGLNIRHRHGRVGAAGGAGAPEGISRETMSKERARGHGEYTEEELEEIRSRDTTYQGGEMTQGEKVRYRVSDPETAEKVVFKELWPELEGRAGKIEEGQQDDIYDALDEWDLHPSYMTRDKFKKNFDDPGRDHTKMRDRYENQLSLAVLKKEAKGTAYDSASERHARKQAEFEEGYRLSTTREQRLRDVRGRRRNEEGS